VICQKFLNFVLKSIKLACHMDVSAFKYFSIVYIIAFSALTMLVGSRKGIRPVNTEWWGAGMVICLG